jgi:hypothetical protein
MNYENELSGYENLSIDGFKTIRYNPMTGTFINCKNRIIGTRNNMGYQLVNGRLAHRLAYESCRGPIPEGFVIDHVDGDKTNNKLANLDCVTQRENLIKGWRQRKNRSHKSRTPVRAINLMTNESREFRSISSAAKALHINPAMVKFNADGIYKSSSCKDGCKFTFEYL